MRIFFSILLLCVVSCQASYAPYDPRLAKAGAILSGLAYCPDSDIASFSCHQCKADEVSMFIMDSILYASSNDLHGYTGVFVNRDTNSVSLSVVFRGTYSVRDWIDDLEFKQIPYRPNSAPGMMIHEGFYESYMSVNSQAVASLGKLIDKYAAGFEFELTCMGHSLGAACAQIACLELMTDPKIAAAINRRVNVYNYGQPRVGNAAFAEWSEQQLTSYYRLVHNKDIVPHVPPTLSASISYIHGGVEMFYNEDFSSVVQCMLGEDEHCSDAHIDDSIPDHLDYLHTPLDGFFYCGSS
eukprot:ANDGO_05693.mRNA.1 Lipase